MGAISPNCKEGSRWLVVPHADEYTNHPGGYKKNLGS
jgi:hypothetical protein